VNNELVRMWKESVVAQFKTVSQNLPVLAKKTTRNLNKDSQCLS
jgi:hypothetical protein